MSATTSIEWTEKTWNPVRGCSIVSPGCVNCYAMKTAHRFSAVNGTYQGLTKQTKAGPQWTGIVRTVESALLEPLSWRKPLKVFVNSMSDLFHEDVPDAFIDKVFAVMAWADRHTFQILTKRPERMRAYLTAPGVMERVNGEAMCAVCLSAPGNLCGHTEEDCQLDFVTWPLPNVWLGVSVENQTFAPRIWELLKTPAAIRFASLEPLLGPVDLNSIEALCETWRRGYTIGTYLDWVIVGGESGPCARPFDVAWARSIVAQCQAAGVAVFVKQLGAAPFNSADSNIEWVFDDRKGGDPTEWPAGLRVREFPKDGRV